jgi:hypothetical protein
MSMNHTDVCELLRARSIRYCRPSSQVALEWKKDIE